MSAYVVIQVLAAYSTILQRRLVVNRFFNSLLMLPSKNLFLSIRFPAHDNSAIDILFGIRFLIIFFYMYIDTSADSPVPLTGLRSLSYPLTWKTSPFSLFNINLHSVISSKSIEVIHQAIYLNEIAISSRAITQRFSSHVLRADRIRIPVFDADKYAGILLWQAKLVLGKYNHKHLQK